MLSLHCVSPVFSPGQQNPAAHPSAAQGVGRSGSLRHWAEGELQQAVPGTESCHVSCHSFRGVSAVPARDLFAWNCASQGVLVSQSFTALCCSVPLHHKTCLGWELTPLQELCWVMPDIDNNLKTLEYTQSLTAWLRLMGTSGNPPAQSMLKQDHIQTALKYLQGWRLQNLSGQLVPVLSHP